MKISLASGVNQASATRPVPLGLPVRVTPKYTTDAQGNYYNLQTGVQVPVRDLSLEQIRQAQEHRYKRYQH